MEDSQNWTIETDELQALIDAKDENLKIVCGSWNYGSDAPDAKLEFEEERIPNSVYFSIVDIADTESGMMATLPSTDKFIAEMKRLGIKRTHKIVVYEHKHIFACLRATFMLRSWGAQDVRVLNGCFKKWKEEGREVASGPAEDVNDTSEEGYDYKLDESMWDNYDSTFKKVAEAESKPYYFSFLQPKAPNQVLFRRRKPRLPFH